MFTACAFPGKFLGTSLNEIVDASLGISWNSFKGSNGAAYGKCLTWSFYNWHVGNFPFVRPLENVKWSPEAYATRLSIHETMVIKNNNSSKFLIEITYLLKSEDKKYLQYPSDILGEFMILRYRASRWYSTLVFVAIFFKYTNRLRRYAMQ